MSTELLSIEEEVFKVLANQKRLEIILLLENRELNVTQMTQMLGLRQSNLSQHLTLLRQQKLVSVRKNGRESFYKLTDQSIAKAIRTIHEVLRAQHRIELPLNSKSLFPIVTDPVCGMRFSASQSIEYLTDSEGITQYFCASGCKQAYAVSSQLAVSVSGAQ